MEDFVNLLQRDYGLKPQGKSAPMASSYVPAKASGNQGGSWNRGNNGLAGLPTRTSSLPMEDGLDDAMFFGSTNLTNKSSNSMGNSDFATSKGSVDNVFGDSLQFGLSKQPTKSSAFDNHDSFSTPVTSFKSKSNSCFVYDMPTYNNDIFGGVPGMRSNSNSAPYEDVLGLGASRVNTSDDLLGGFAVVEPSRSKPEAEQFLDASSSVLQDQESDELLPGFGSSEPLKTTSRANAKPFTPRDGPLFSVDGSTSVSTEMDPFGGVSSEPISLDNSSSVAASTFVGSLEDPFEMRIPEAHNPEIINLKPKGYVKNTVVNNVFGVLFQSKASEFSNVHPGSSKTTTVKDEAVIPPVASVSDISLEAQDVHSTATDHKVDHFPPSPPRQEANDKFSSSEPVVTNPRKKSVRFDDSAMKEKFAPSDSTQRIIKEVWVTIDDVRLVTNPTRALPPSRPAPRLDLKRTSAMKKSEQKTGISKHSDAAKGFYNETFSRVPAYNTPSIEDLENFVPGGIPPEAYPDAYCEEDQLPTAKLNEALKRVEGRLKTARGGMENFQEGKDREAKTVRFKEGQDKIEKEARILQERAAKEREAKEEKERQTREMEIEREKDRAAVDRATREARERAAEKALAEVREWADRAAAEARQRAERIAVECVTADAQDRAAAEVRESAAADAREKGASEVREQAAAEAKQTTGRAAVERATAEARARTERAAVERVNAEVRERAAEKVAAERAAAELRERAEKAAVQRAAAEARDRAEKAAAQRAASAAAAARDQQQQSDDNDLERFFNMSSYRAANAPKQRPSTPESVPEHKGRSPTVSSSVRKVSATTNINDDWTSLFGPPSTADFQEIDGEAPERRKARWERHQRTLERSAQALAEKNQRDLDAQHEQAEKHRAADALDAEIRRWAAGKEGNLRALLSTLQYVLWPECGWQPVSLTDLITGASVKKVYRKATLYVHPDKVQQKGATVQQKYVAEKVFDLLKEAWNKLNSEELF